MKLLYILSIFLLLTSCTKIQPLISSTNIDKNVIEENINNESGNEKHSKVCWINSCELSDTLSEKYELWELNLPDLSYYKDRFSILLSQFPTKNKLIESSYFHEFVNDLNYDFFWCKWNIYECTWSIPYWKDETNYLFYIFIPLMVIDNNLNEKWWTDWEIETIIQSIKRKDFDSTMEKEVKIYKYKEKIKKIISEIQIEKIDTNKLKNDNKYFEKIILDNKNWLHDKIISEIYNINIDWEEEWQMDEIVDFTTWELFKLLEQLSITKELFINKIIEINTYNKKEYIIKSIISDLNKKINNLDFSYLNLPNDRYLRNDELYIFKNPELYSNQQTNENLLYIRHKILLLFTLWKEEKLYDIINRLSQYNFEKKFLLTNIFKYSKYIKIDEKFIP